MSRPSFTLTTPSECGEQALKIAMMRVRSSSARRDLGSLHMQTSDRQKKRRLGSERLSLAGAIGTVTLTLWVWCALQLLQS